MVYNSRTSDLLECNISGARIFELIDGKRTVAEIAQTISNEFNNGPEESKLIELVVSFLNECRELGLVTQ